MRICTISDTHNTQPKLPDADLLVHLGDLTSSGRPQPFEDAIRWLGLVGEGYPKGVLVTPGNHDLIVYQDEPWARELCKEHNVTLLVHEEIVIDGIKFFLSPYSTVYGFYPFMGSELYLAEKWRSIPKDVNFLGIHGPAQGLRDLCRGGHPGSSSLRYLLDNKAFIDMKVFACGHIHEGGGWHIQKRNDGSEYIYLNAAVLNVWAPGLYHDITVIDTNTWTVENALKDEAI